MTSSIKNHSIRFVNSGALSCTTSAFLEIDAVVSMIEKVLENTDSYLQEEFSTRGLASDSDNGKSTFLFPYNKEK